MSTTNFGRGHAAQAQEAPVRGSGDGYSLRSRSVDASATVGNRRPTPVRYPKGPESTLAETTNLTLVPNTLAENENLTLVTHRELKAGPMAPPSDNFSQTVTTSNTVKNVGERTVILADAMEDSGNTVGNVGADKINMATSDVTLSDSVEGATATPHHNIQGQYHGLEPRVRADNSDIAVTTTMMMTFHNFAGYGFNFAFKQPDVTSSFLRSGGESRIRSRSRRQS